MTTKTIISQDVQKLNDLLKKDWKKLSAAQLAQIDAPVSLFNLMTETWSKLLSVSDDIKLSLELCKATFTSISFKAFANALRNNTTIEFLALRNITNTEAAILAETLTHNTTLSQLNLTNNFIGDEGAAAFVELLQNNTSLIWIDFSQNNIGDDGAHMIASKNNNLAYINLTNNPISVKGLRKLSNMALSCLTKCSIWVTHNNNKISLPVSL